MQTNDLHFEIVKYSSIAETPEAWDELTESYFQSRSFLEYNERYNPCRQRYYVVFSERKPVAAAVVYTLSINILTFLNIPSPIRMHVIGLPVSVSAPGVFGDPEMCDRLLAFLMKAEPGLLLGMNLDPQTNVGKGVQMRMMPTLELDRAFDNLEDYAASLRAPYRRRFRQIMDKWSEIHAVRTDCSAFTIKHYNLYKQVMAHSSTKLETLTKAYFAHLPGNFYLTTYYHGNKMLCWHINCSDESHGRMYFFFGGHHYKFNHTHDSYFNNLAGVLKEGINAGFSRIDFGQTAEIPKMRLGARSVPKSMFLYHRNPLILFLLRSAGPLLEYKRDIPESHVFSEETPIAQPI